MRAIHLLTVLAVVCAPVATARAETQTVALLPAVGGAEDGDKKAFDAALRKGFAGADGVDLQSSADTKRHVLSMAELGLVCLPDDIACMAKLGLAADVALVLVPVVAPSDADGDAFEVTIDVVDVAAIRSLRTARATIAADDTDAIENLVDKALGRTGAASPDPEPQPDPDPRPDPDPEPEPAPSSDAGPPLSTIGFAVAGVGGGVLALGVAGALFCELAYAGLIDGFDAQTRAGVIRPAGIALWITGAVGAVGLASGLVVALVVAAPPEE